MHPSPPIRVIFSSDEEGFFGSDFLFPDGGGFFISSPKRRKHEKENSTRFLCEEMHEEILVKLPIKSLMRFKSVSKSWRSLIRSRSFVDEFRRQRQHRRPYHQCYSDKLVFSPYYDTHKMTKSSLSTAADLLNLLPLEIRSPKMHQQQQDCPRFGESRCTRSYPGWKRDIRVMGPLNNGIYCVVSNLESSNGRVALASGRIALCNPATRDYDFVTPPFPSDDSSYCIISNSDRNRCRVHYGFGTDPQGYYKVVVVLTWGPIFSNFMTFVYSFRHRSWRKIADWDIKRLNRPFCYPKAMVGLEEGGGVCLPEIVQDLELCPQRFLNGRWHWMGATNSTYYVVSFNLDDDTFGLIHGPVPYLYDYQPPESEDYPKGGGVFVLNDCLALIYLPVPCVEISVWMMMDYGVEESWTKIYAIEPNFLGGEFSRIVGIQIDDREGIRRIFFEDDERKQLISCDDSGYKAHNVYQMSSAIWWNTLGISTYTETIEPL